MTSPVFVDPSGRRRWVLRIVIGTAVTCVLAYLTLLAVALAGGPVNRSALLPVPDEEAPVVVTTAVVTTTTTQVPVVITTTRATTATSTTTDDTTTTTTTETATTKPSAQGRRSEAPGASNRPTPGKG
ncbi:carbohydrate-binding DOMON domain-containing protein [Saccharothrix ecbatanensis]|uniref:Carbohydrate-binding DOMON domain-containing protein n=1 Tax=Saccharothrix ecbatanensis TaxID=1105145 RepID=A0A7W9HPT7_9PSEU|nr:hypothetical protein [Saccharothrix ecbatanensis]MBB5806011.1 carbohydrate-binding DOMON domain-containing protein [Saccharothrix ecbatanensis]